ncbi:uncharacterized protein PV09_06820 [Verruconis gallopava]|uniref:Heterokaryon incompatibility domain-containing protein n=1 Tax=Verruconis gallopava TaxID=253628 RepID=A0A0D2A4C3_9PEZI|nr:uncharacterized protein PV09_06820 [Verruconis gallopava]KIW01633.1 hypothetical protein PV09_06820 [Verruconis gallopava]
MDSSTSAAEFWKVLAGVPGSTDFRYSSLSSDMAKEEIRILDLLPGDPSSPVRCGVRHIGLTDQTEKWFAVSYCWDTENQSFRFIGTKTIFCDGQPFLISDNLHDALIRLRELADGASLPVWIDAICINQSDLREKSRQIALMRQIFAGAHKVFVWLGADTADTALAFDFVQEMHEAAAWQISQHGKTDDRRLKNLSAEQRAALRIDRITPEKVEAFSNLLRRKWWRRVWVIQEFALARDVEFLCGRFSTSEARFSAALRSSHSLGLLGVLPCALYDQPVMLHAVREEMQRNEKKPLFDLLRRFRRFQATDLRDKVFAICALANDVGENPSDLHIQIDYEVKYLELFKSISLQLAIRDMNLDFLTAAGYWLNSYAGPSWVPDWKGIIDADNVFLSWISTFTPRPLDFDPDFRQPEMWYRASKDSKLRRGFKESNDVLKVYGYTFDRISQLGPELETSGALESSSWTGELPMSENIEHMWRTLVEWEAMVEAAFARRYKDETSLDVYWQVLVGGVRPGDSRQFRDLQQSFGSWRREIRGGFGGTPGSDADPRVDFLERAGGAFGKRLFITKKGYIGLGPSASQVDDRVVLLEGGKVPFVMRKSLFRRMKIPGMPNKALWQLIGTAYVHGCMLGEVYSSYRCSSMLIE